MIHLNTALNDDEKESLLKFFSDTLYNKTNW